MEGYTVEKAYYIGEVDEYYENHYLNYEPIYAETSSKAKYKASKKLNLDNFERRDKQEITFMNVKVYRMKDEDLFINNENGQKSTRMDIERMSRIKQRDEEYEKILAKNPNGFGHIVKRGAYYCDDYNGYTEHYVFGGVYPLKDAFKHVKGCDDYGLHVRVIEDVKEHNERVQRSIDNLKGHLING